MFICQDCLKKSNPGIWFFAQSYGTCEDCGKRTGCADIPTKLLIENREKNTVTGPDYELHDGSQISEGD